MPESPAVALLFGDVALGGQLRGALIERGARIVHEGALGSLEPEQLLAVDPDVLVVNLETEDDEALDALYALIEGERPRVVFNDAQASRKLEGWDRARWARHLAMKALALGEVDPPRPEDARDIEVAAVAVAAPAPVAAAVDESPAHQQTVAASETLAAELEALLAAEQIGDALDGDFDGMGRGHAPLADVGASSAEPVAHDGVADFAVDNTEPEELIAPAMDLADDELRHGFRNDADDRTLADEPHAQVDGGSLDMLEPRARTGTPADDVEDFLRGFEDTAETSPWIDQPDADTRTDDIGTGSPSGHAGAAAMLDLDADAGLNFATGFDTHIHTDAEPAPPTTPTAWLELGSLEEASVAGRAPGEPPPLPPMPRVPDGWSLVDDDALLAPLPPAEKVSPSVFGIERQDPAEYLAPSAETRQDESPVSPGLTLELMSIEEAIAPQHYQPVHEMMLDERATRLSRLVLLGATTEATTAVCEFLAALPADLPATVLHTQHQAGKPSDALVEHFAENCALPVRLATAGMRARQGEVLVVPTDQQVRLRRDGIVEMQAIGAQGGHSPSIDTSLTIAAGEFGADALAIVFAGRSTDAVAGCQAIHDRGGEVWVEANPAGESGAGMVSGVQAERLAHYSGTPRELAARLVEQTSMESRS